MDDDMTIREKAAAILSRHKLDMLEEVGLTVVEQAPEGFDSDCTFYCKKCGEEAIQCEFCGKWICPDCNAKYGGEDYYCNSCWGEFTNG